MFKEFGWDPETCYKLSEFQISNIVEALAQDKPGVKGAGPAQPNPPQLPLKRPKPTLNDKVAAKAKKLGRKLTQAELFALI